MQSIRLVATVCLAMVGNAHRKAGWMIRQSLDADSPYVDAVIHGDGLASLQYRKVQGGPTITMSTRSPSKAARSGA